MKCPLSWIMQNCIASKLQKRRLVTPRRRFVTVYLSTCPRLQRLARNVPCPNIIFPDIPSQFSLHNQKLGIHRTNLVPQILVSVPQREALCYRYTVGCSQTFRRGIVGTVRPTFPIAANKNQRKNSTFWSFFILPQSQVLLLILH